MAAYYIGKERLQKNKRQTSRKAAGLLICAIDPLLSMRDITELLDIYLPRKGRNEQEIIAQIRQRRADIDRRENHKLGLPKI